MRYLLGFFLFVVVQGAVASSGELGLVLRFCTPGVAVADIERERDCTLPTRPELPDDYGTAQQLVLATVQNSEAAHTETAFWITPYYLRQIMIFKLEGDGWQKVAQGGAQLGSTPDSAGLGGHRLAVPAAPGTNTFLIEINAPNFAHLSIRLDDKGHVSNKQEILLALHLGMLLLLFVLVMSAWVIRPAALEARLAVLTSFVFLSVLIGSGAIYRIWPGASVHWVGFFLFNAAVAIRIGAITWVYASMIRPYNDTHGYRVLNGLTYVVTATAVGLFALDLPAYGWPLVGMLLLLALFAPAWGLWTAKPMPRLLLVAVLGSVLFYLALNLFAFYSLLHTSGQNDWPVYAIRTVDLALPLMLFALVILRNRVADRELEQAQAEVARKVAQLNAQHRLNEEKRMLLDMLTHEVKNPLASIRFAVRNLSELKDQALDIRQRKLHGIKQSVQSIDEIIDRCNLANGLEEQTIEPQIEPVRIDELILDLIDASEQPQRFTLSVAPVAAIDTDPYLVKIVLLNLLDNAVRYAPADSTIEVTVAQNQQGVFVVSVANQLIAGTTLNPAQLFERYYRHESAQHIRGSGLGLALSQAVCALIGARIICEIESDYIEFEVSFETP